MMTPEEKHSDGDIHKGAVESDRPEQTPGQPRLQNQQVHRTDIEEIKDSDTDFPEPDPTAEHSGQHK